MRIRIIAAMAALFLTGGAAAQSQVAIEDLVSLAKFTTVQLSPDGKHIAAGMRDEADALMVVMDISDPKRPKIVYQMKPGQDESVGQIRWVSDERLLFSTQDAVGTLAQQAPTGKIFAVNFDGSKPFVVQAPGQVTGRSFFSLNGIVDTMPEDDKVIKVMTSAQGRGQQMELVNVYRQRWRTLAKSPFDSGSLVADNDGNPRFAFKLDDSTNTPVYAYRPTTEADWVEFESPFKGTVFP
ncbi:MAG: LpqB family beta-propeller domain-containing protein, partial [Pseudomonadota bacterium]